MKLNLRQIVGNWDDGYVLNKHTLSSVCIGHNEAGYPEFETTRSEPGEALFQLKYRGDISQATILARAVFEHIVPLLPAIGLIIPMPPSNLQRQFQPVHLVAAKLALLMGVNVIEGVLVKRAPPLGTPSLKNLDSKQEKLDALSGLMYVSDVIDGDGPWNALLIDDLFDSGASMETAVAVLRKYPKISRIYVAALTWK